MKQWEPSVSHFPKPVSLTSQTLTRPADTTAYASGDLVANDTTAGSVVVPKILAVARQLGYKSRVRRVGLFASKNDLTNAAFRIHFFSAAPTFANGDNGAFVVATNADKWLGSVDVTLLITGAGGAVGWATTEMNFSSSSAADLWFAIEARGAYTPASAETFKVLTEADQY